MVLREVSKIDVNYVKKLYKEAFPIRERMPFSRLLKLQKNNIIKIKNLNIKYIKKQANF